MTTATPVAIGAGARLAVLAVVIALPAASAQAGPRIRSCFVAPRCPAPSEAAAPVAAGEAAKATLRAVNTFLAADAARMAIWSHAPVLVASELRLRLPRRYRRVPTSDEGKRILAACSAERFLDVVVPGEVRRSSKGDVSVDLTVESFSAICERPDRHVLAGGKDSYEVILHGVRAEVLLRSRITF